MSSDDEQLARTQLRSGFLSVINNLKERKSELVTCEGNSLECTFISVDRCIENISVENLKTPIGSVLPHAVVRLPDLDKIVFRKSS